jgi:hypothetical protein
LRVCCEVIEVEVFCRNDFGWELGLVFSLNVIEDCVDKYRGTENDPWTLGAG